MLNNPSVALVFLNYNNIEYLKKNLSFTQNITYTNHKVYIIDNGSSDNSISFVKEYYPKIKIIPLQNNKGFAEGYNTGLSMIKEDYFLLLNTDVEVTPSFIEPLIELMEQNKKVGICQPKILSQERKNYFEYAGGSGGFMDTLGYTFTRGRIFDTLEKDYGQYEDTIPIFWASGACFFIKAELFKQLNGFYTYYFMYSEEVDLCWRAQIMGYKVYVCPKSVVFHRETDKLINQNPKRLYYVFRNNLIMLHLNLKLMQKCFIIPLRFLLNILAFLLFIFKGHFYNAMQIAYAHLAYVKWVTIKKKNQNIRNNLKDIPTIYKRSILIDYYFLNRKKYKELTIK